MPSVQQGQPNEPIYKIPVENEEFEELPKRSTRNLETVRKTRNELKSAQLIAIEKERIGEVEYQRRLALRIRRMI